jgi:hypothetical protein
VRDLSVEEALALLDVSTDACKLCQNELDKTGVVAVGHNDAGHPPPRRVVHSMAGTFGADWDEEAARDFIRRADRLTTTTGWVAATGHNVAARAMDDGQPRWVAFSAVAE